MFTLFSSESLSFTFSPLPFVKSDISAMFVILVGIGFVDITLQAIFTSLYDSVVPSNAGILFSPATFSFALDKYVVFTTFEFWLSTDQPYFLFVSLSAINSNWSGKWSVISSTYPSTPPSL